MNKSPFGKTLNRFSLEPICSNLQTRMVISLVVMTAFFIQNFLILLPIQVRASTLAPLLSVDIVISQAYGGGGGSTGTYVFDFVELKNIASTSKSLSGLSLMYGSSAGQFGSTSTNVYALPNVSLQPGQYYLVQLGAAGTGGAALPVTPDATTTNLSMAAGSGKVALTNGLTANTCGVTATPCVLPHAQIVDLVSWGAANNAEGNAPTNGGTALVSTQGNVRKTAGCTETDNNNADFDVITAPVPRNASSTLDPCGGGGGATNPSGVGAANPSPVNAGSNSLLTVTVTPGTNPTSTGLLVSGNLTLIGGSASQMFFDDGTNGDVTPGDKIFSYNATVGEMTTGGAKMLPFSITDAQTRMGTASINLTVNAPPGPVNHVVISQVYGGGGGTGATYTNDFVELFNPTAATVDVSGWSVQYASATGTLWSSTQPIGGTIGPGQYYLISLATGGATGAPLPPANIVGDINMSATAGKIALVNNFDQLPDGCPLTVTNLVDLVGYGTTANCFEGAGRAPAPSNTSADLRKSNGAQDTNDNSADFLTLLPNPRRTAPIVEIGPAVFNVDPRSNNTIAPRDASMTITFTEPVFVDPNWFNIMCGTTGLHNSATVAGSSRVYVITPNINFAAGEVCTVTILKDFVHDQDTDDPPDTMLADYVWSFTVATGNPPPYPASVHLTMGNPSNATIDVNQPLNYLTEKPELALSYNRDRGIPNWVSWHLDTSWTGSLTRIDTFRPDPQVLPAWYRVQATDYSGSGFDRGHMTPNADRNNQDARPVNQATFLMTNMVPQSPDNNQGPWAVLENDLRALLTTKEIYIVSGGAGTGGTGTNGGVTNTVGGGNVSVPAYTWKAALILDSGTNDLARVDNTTRIISVIMPNIQGIRTDNWRNYLATVDQIEAMTGYDLFSNVAPAIQAVIESNLDAPNNIGPQNVTGGSYTNLSINAPQSTLTGNVMVTGNLNLGSSHLTTGSFKITLGPNATVTRLGGYVIGNVERQFENPLTLSPALFEYPVGTTNGYSPVTVNVTALGISPSSLTVKAVQNAHPNTGMSNVSLNRYWTLTESGDLTADLTFKYLDADVPAGTPENTFTLQRYNMGFTPIPAVINIAANTATANGINEFSDWALIAPIAPTAANVEVEGRVFSSVGKAVFGATVAMIDQSGNLRMTRTNPFGYYRFYNVESGYTYLVNVQHKQHQFAPQVVTVFDNIEQLNFVGIPSRNSFEGNTTNFLEMNLESVGKGLLGKP